MPRHPLLHGSLMIHKQIHTRDFDPSDMTDFEKNTTQGELEQVGETEPSAAPAVPNPSERNQALKDAERKRQERGNRGPGEQPGFGQGA